MNHILKNIEAKMLRMLSAYNMESLEEIHYSVLTSTLSLINTKQAIILWPCQSVYIKESIFRIIWAIYFPSLTFKWSFKVGWTMLGKHTQIQNNNGMSATEKGNVCVQDLLICSPFQLRLFFRAPVFRYIRKVFHNQMREVLIHHFLQCIW